MAGGGAIYFAGIALKARNLPRRIDISEFGSGSAAPFPLLKPAPSHAAQHLLLDVKLALPAGAAGLASAAGAAGKAGAAVNGGSLQGGSASVLDAVGEMTEAALAAAGLPVQRRQAGSFPSFRRRPFQADGMAASRPEAAGDAKQTGLEQQQQQRRELNSGSKAGLLEGSTDEEEGAKAGPDMFFLSCR